MNKQDLINRMNEELFESETNDKEFFVLSLIKQHFEDNYKDEDNEIVKGLSEYQCPLLKAYQIFTGSVDIEKVLEKVYQDFFNKEQTEKQQTVFFDENSTEDDFIEDTDEDDEGFIHDNEDC